MLCPFHLLFQAQKLKAHHGWLLNTLAYFKAPNAISKAALFTSRVDVGSHSLEVKTELRDLALQVSSHLVCFHLPLQLHMETIIKVAQ